MYIKLIDNKNQTVYSNKDNKPSFTNPKVQKFMETEGINVTETEGNGDWSKTGKTVKIKLNDANFHNRFFEVATQISEFNLNRCRWKFAE